MLARIPLISSIYRRAVLALSSATMGADGCIARVRGLTMYLDPGEDPGRNGAFLWGKFEPATVAVFTRLITHGDVIIDVGAHWGYFTLLAADLCGVSGRVFSFEPHPKNYALLVRNVEVNHLSNVQTVHKAVSDRSGKAILFEAWYTTGHSLRALSGLALSQGTRPAEIAVETVTLDDFFGANPIQPRLVKMDIEGSEPLALAGMRRLIERSPHLVLILEFNPSYLSAAASEFLDALADQGFEIAVIDDERCKLDLGPWEHVMRRLLKESEGCNLLITREMKSVAPMLGYKGALENLHSSLNTVHF